MALQPLQIRSLLAFEVIVTQAPEVLFGLSSESRQTRDWNITIETLNKTLLMRGL